MSYSAKLMDKLVIISHTKHYRTVNGDILGWGPTISEINQVSCLFKEVVHIGCFYTEEPPLSSLKYTNTNIKFVPIPPFGGKSIISKLKILRLIFTIIGTININLNGASHVQLRLPTGIGVFLLPYFAWFKKRNFNFWVKYAGNWKQSNPPLGYKFQRWFLIKNFLRSNVTINGFWENQPSHCISFENPCLTEEMIQKGKEICVNKFFSPPFKFIFVGRLDESKGVSRIIEAMKDIPENYIKELCFVGNGNEIEKYKSQINFLGNKVKFLGFLAPDNVHAELQSSHFILLPSDNEGFPKVIAEGANYGCIPIVSDVSSIGHYINNTNGYLWDIKSDITYKTILSNAVYTDKSELDKKSKNLLKLAPQFSYAHFLSKLQTNILKR